MNKEDIIKINFFIDFVIFLIHPTLLKITFKSKRNVLVTFSKFNQISQKIIWANFDFHFFA